MGLMIEIRKSILWRLIFKKVRAYKKNKNKNFPYLYKKLNLFILLLDIVEDFKMIYITHLLEYNTIPRESVSAFKLVFNEIIIKPIKN